MFRFLVDAVQDYSIYYLTPDGIVGSWNAGAKRIKGYENDEIIGKPFATFFTGEDRIAGVPERNLAEAKNASRFETEGWRVRKDGSKFWAHVTMNTVTDDAGILIGFAKITRDVTVARDNARALQLAASTDPLTGMWNRSSFLKQLDAWASEQKSFSVSIIDLNDFKLVNDTYGHAVGDTLLKTAADQLRANEHLGIIAARLGGDEFAAAALTPVPSAITEFASAITRSLASRLTVDEDARVIDASIGVATFPQDAIEVSELLVCADTAMYQAKEINAKSPVRYREGLHQTSASRRALDRQIVGAIHRGEFELQYQPQASLSDGSVVGYEALVRWQHPILGVIHPGEFIPLAEANGSIVELGEWVLTRACQEASQWREHARIAVNVSAAQLQGPDFAGTVKTTLQNTGLAPHRLELEITESILISHRREVVSTFESLQELGVLIALDDFGTGFSSLDTLLTFAFDRVKIDRSVLHESLQTSRTRGVLRAILALGHALTATVLVEGVETAHQLAVLRDEGFDEVQGYLTGRPGKGPEHTSTSVPEGRNVSSACSHQTASPSVAPHLRDKRLLGDR